MIINFFTPTGTVTIDSETVTGAELAALSLTRDQFNEDFNIIYLERAYELLSNPPTTITQPEIWELMRIFGRHLGFHD